MELIFRKTNEKVENLKNYIIRGVLKVHFGHMLLPNIKQTFNQSKGQIQIKLSQNKLLEYSSVISHVRLFCDPMNRSTPGLPVYHQLPEFTQTHAHQVGDAIQPSHPLSSPSPPAHNPFQHQGLFQ